jgi:hypothetical protein
VGFKAERRPDVVSERDLHQAAVCWCTDTTSSIQMDERLAKVIAAALAEARREGAEAMRERCARECEWLGTSGVQCDDGEWEPFDNVYGGRQATDRCAAAIRALDVED